MSSFFSSPQLLARASSLYRPTWRRSSLFFLMLGSAGAAFSAGSAAQAGAVLVSGGNGTVANASSISSSFSLSADGTRVAFASLANNLVSGDTNGLQDVFVKDFTTGTITRVNLDTNGGQTTAGRSTIVSMSADGTRVAFISDTSNLVSGDTNGAQDVFVRDTTNNTTVRVSLANDGSQSTENSFDPVISADGTKVVFASDASNLVSSDTNGTTDLFVRDLNANTTTRVNVANDGSQSVSVGFRFGLSDDGTKVVFDSGDSNLVSGDTNGAQDVFVRDLSANTTTLVSRSSSGVQSNSESSNASISGDGTKVSFRSDGTNLVDGDTNGQTDVFVRDLVNNTTTRVSVATNGTQTNNFSNLSRLNSDGTRVLFESFASNLVSNDTNGVQDLFVRDVTNNVTIRVNLANNGDQANGSASSAAISSDGTKVAYQSNASNLVSGDTNSVSDVFVSDVVIPTLSLNDVTHSEGNSGTTFFAFTISLNTPSLTTITGNYATANGSATADSDYFAISDTFTFFPGQTSKTLTIAVNGDTDVENNETFFVNLTGTLGAAVSDAQGLGTITNDDGTNLAPTAIALSRTQVKEKQGTNAFVAGLSATDPDAGETFTYSLPAGVDDNAAFAIDGTNLRTAQDFDAATKSSYTITIRVTDSAGNVYDQQFTISVLEITRPTVAISAPSANAKILLSSFTPSSITGTATDNVGVSKVQVRLSRKRGNVNQYWNGTDFVTTQSTVLADLNLPNWSLTTNAPPVAKLDAGIYDLQVAAFDAAGNKSAYATRSFTLIASADTTKPTIAISTPAQNQQLNINSFGAGTISGTASDDSAVTSVKIKLQRSRGGVLYYWNGTDFVPTVTLVDATYSNGTWNYATPIPANKLDRGGYTLYATAYDAVGNKTTSPSRIFAIIGAVAAPDATTEGGSAGRS